MRCATISVRSSSSRRTAARLKKSPGDVASRVPCPQPLRLTKDQENAAGPDLAKLLAQRVAFHHSGLSYMQRAGLIEPLAKGGQLRVVVATLGLSAGINFSLRSVLVTGTSFTAGGLPREVAPSDLLQMFGRAGRRGLDDQGYVLVSERSPRLGQARAGHLRRSLPLPWRPLLQALARGGPIDQVSVDFQKRLFTTEFIPLGIEVTKNVREPLPCGLRTDPGRARLVRRIKDPAPFCLTCPHRAESLALDPKPTLLWLWNRLGILDKHLQLTRRGRIMACFSGPEGLGVLAGLEDEKYPLVDLCEDMANLVAGDRFCGNEPRWGGRLAHRLSEGPTAVSPAKAFWSTACPSITGAGGAEIVRALRQKKYVPMQGLEEHVHRGDVDRLVIEWKSLLRQIAIATVDASWSRWSEFQALCRAEYAPYERTSLPGLPVISAEQQKPVSHRLSMAGSW